MSTFKRVKKFASALDLSVESKPDILKRLDELDDKLTAVMSAIEQLQQVQTNVHTTLRSVQAEVSDVRRVRRQ